MHSIKFNLLAISREHGIKINALATEVTERTEVFNSSLRDVGWALPTITHVGQCPTYAMTKKDGNQNLFFSVCSVTSVAKNKANRYSTQSNFGQYK